MDAMPTLDEAARAFLESALVALRKEHVVPTPMFNPFLRVGRDYFGGSIGGTSEFEAAIAARHPRFSDDAPSRDRDFASRYVFSFLEAFVAEAVLSGDCRVSAMMADPRSQSPTGQVPQCCHSGWVQ